MGSLMLQFQRAHKANTGTVVGQLPEVAPPAPPTGLPSGLMAGQQLAAFCTASLTEDLLALKEVSSHASRDITKRDVLIPKYADYVRRLREDGYTHELIGYYLVWLMDSGMVEEGLELALWCVNNRQPLPESFSSHLPYFVSDTLLTWAEAETAAGGREQEDGGEQAGEDRKRESLAGSKHGVPPKVRWWQSTFRGRGLKRNHGWG